MNISLSFPSHIIPFSSSDSPNLSNAYHSTNVFFFKQKFLKYFSILILELNMAISPPIEIFKFTTSWERPIQKNTILKA